MIVWLVHTSVDWLHLIPGVTGVALCGAAVLVAPWRGTATSRVPAGLLAAIVIAVAIGAYVLATTTFAARAQSDGIELLDRDPVAALGKAEDALALNDESMPAYYLKSAAHARLGDFVGARDALLEASRREPHDFVVWGLLGDLSVRRGQRRQAIRFYRQAASLNPRDLRLRSLAGGRLPEATP